MLSSQMQPLPSLTLPSPAQSLELVILGFPLETYPETTQALKEHEGLTPPEFRNEGTPGANSCRLTPAVWWQRNARDSPANTETENYTLIYLVTFPQGSQSMGWNKMTCNFSHYLPSRLTVVFLVLPSWIPPWQALAWEAFSVPKWGHVSSLRLFVSGIQSPQGQLNGTNRRWEKTSWIHLLALFIETSLYTMPLCQASALLRPHPGNEL